MQEICSLASTGTNIAIITALGFGLIAVASLFLYQLKTGKIFSKGMLSLVLMFSLLGSLLLVPATVSAGGAAQNCPTGTQASQTATDGNQAVAPVTPGLTCPENWVVVPGNPTYNTEDFCLMKYSAKNSGGTVASTHDINGDGSFLSNTYTGGTAVSSPTDQPWTNISQTDAITAAQTANVGAHLITENEWMTVAHNILAQPANWCDADGSNCGNAPGTAGKVLASGHNDNAPSMPLEASATDSQACFGTVTAGTDTACGSDPSTQKRTLTLSNGAVLWDLVGNVAHWTAGTETQGNLPSNGGSGGAFEYSTDTGFGLPVPDDYGTLAYTNPAIHNPAAASWGVSNGLGFLFSDFSSGSPTVIAFCRGGAWDGGPFSGAFTLFLVNTPSHADTTIGFRAAL